jgi:hypothetical protein
MRETTVRNRSKGHLMPKGHLMLAMLVVMALCIATASAATTVLDPGPGTGYLSIWCGGQAVREIATGFDAAGNATTLVTVATTCHGSGRGSPNQYYLACWNVTFAEDGTIQSKVWQATNHWVQGNPAVPCPAPADPAAVYTFTDGAGHFPATLSTQSVGTSTTNYRAVLETTCAPMHFGDTVSGTIGTPGDSACFSFVAAAGDGARVGTVATSGALLPGQEVVGPDGAVLCGAATGTLDCALEAAGRHVIVVNDYNGTGTGGFDLSLSCTTPGCAPFDYALSNSGNITVALAASGSNAITATLVSGSSESVAFSVAGLPAGATASFDVAACEPTCASNLYIAASETTPLGTYPITITGAPLDRSTMFNLIVSDGTGVCPAATALASAPDKVSTLGVLHDVRDQVLSRTPAGRRYTRLFYEHAAESVRLMLRDPDLGTRSLALVEQLLPTFKALLAGRPVTLTASDAASIDAVLGAFETGASPRFHADLEAVRQELRQGHTLRGLGISQR